MSEITAVILCGGKGERLRPFTEDLPKPLVTLNGRPILRHLLDYLSQSGVNRFVLCTGYKAECIEQFVRDQCDANWDIRCVNSGDATMTKRLQDAWPHVKGLALVCYGDTLANVDLSRLTRRHWHTGAEATMALYRPNSPFGVVKFDRQRKVRSFLEKPRMPHWINIGFILCDAVAVHPQLCEAKDMVDFLSSLAASGKLHAFEHTGKHLTINTEKERQQAQNEVFEFLSVLDSYS
jgi:glucose-1-phosphate cytidylyltransferase